MDPGLKQRLVGAAVLVALAVIFLPMLVQGPAPDSGVSDVPLSMPEAPPADQETRDLPLVTPGAAPGEEALGLPSGQAGAEDAAAAPPASAVPLPETAPAPAVQAPLPAATTPAAAPPAAVNGEMFPAPTAGGDYAVSFGSFTTATAANAVVASLRASQLPGYREPAQVDGRPVQRVRIGPYATRAEAEAARLRAAHVRDDVNARVVVLDAERAAGKPAAAPATSKPATVAAKPAAVAAGDTGFAVQLAAFSKPADAIALRDRARAAGFSAFTETVATDKGALTRVRIGPVASRADAERLQAQVQAKLGVAGIVRPHP